MITAHVFIIGFVQGIGFRHFVRGKAEDLGLTGWVRNLPDGRVEALFSCEAGSRFARQRIEKMIKFCNKGPFLSEIKDIVVEWYPTSRSGEKFKSFEIL